MRLNCISIIIIGALINCAVCNSQSLTKDRIERLKKSVIRISIEGSDATGTGFFFSPDGYIMTCWHVIAPSIVLDSAGNVLLYKKIFIETNDGKKYETGIPSIFFENSKFNQQAVAYDYCLLRPPSEKISFSYIKLGNFDNINEGDQIYTCGYPLGIKYQFVSSGILSTKYDDPVVYKKPGFPDLKMSRNVALLDLTINKGNSGGPIIKVGKTVQEDEVIGITNFQINPFGQNAQILNEELNKRGNINLPTGISLTESMKLFSNAIVYSSNGISGCVSINHFLQSTR